MTKSVRINLKKQKQMKAKRTLLVVTGILTFIIAQISSADVQNGGRSSVFSLLILLLAVANVILAVTYAKQTDRSPVGWGIGALFVPFITNIILVLLPIKTSVVMKNIEQTSPASSASHDTVNQNGTTEKSLNELFTSFPATEPVFQIKRGLFKKPIELHLDNLRLLAIVITSNFKWRVTFSTHSLQTGYLDLLSDETAHTIYDIFEKAITGTQRDCEGMTICLAEYGNQGIQLQLTEIRNYYPTLPAALYRCHRQRKERLHQWLSENPEVKLSGRFGVSHFLNKTGYRAGHKLTSWADIGLIKIESSNFTSDMLMLPKGSKGGMFATFKAKHTLSIPKSKSDLYLAECNFWRELYYRDEKIM